MHLSKLLDYTRGRRYFVKIASKTPVNNNFFTHLIKMRVAFIIEQEIVAV